MSEFVVYILRTDKNTLYTGYTSNLQTRLKRHNLGKGAKYLRLFRQFKLVYFEKFKTKSEAMRRESEIKKWSKSLKEKLVGGIDRPQR